MNKLSKLTALLLALVLALSVPLGALAESAEIETKSEYYEVADTLLKLKIMAYTSYGEYWDFAKLIEESDFREFFFGLSEDEQNAMAAYVEGMFWDSLVAFTRVAPIPELATAAQSVPVLMKQTRGGTATIASTDTSDGLYTNKTVSGPDKDGYYTITLENYATGKVVTTTTTTTAPVDIVLVLDFSLSMDSAFDGSSSTIGQYTYTAVDPSDVVQGNTYYVKSSSNNSDYTAVNYCSRCPGWASGSSHYQHTTKYEPAEENSGNSGTRKRIFYTRTGAATKTEALQIAVNNFIQKVNDQYTDTANHRISIVTFNSSAKILNDWTYASDDKLAGLRIDDSELNMAMGTYTHQGLASALSQLNKAGTDTTRQKVVVLFTDGLPGNSMTDFDESAAVSAVTNALAIKNQGVSVYSVAVLTGANPKAAIDESATTDNDKINAMLHAISSNYLEATASSSGSTFNTTMGNINPLADVDGSGKIDSEADKSYYLTADSPASLNNIFQQISSSIQTGSSSVSLDETTVIRDVVTPYFEIPYVLNNGNKDYSLAQITIQEAQHTDDNADGSPIFGTPTVVNYPYQISGNQLDVNGFDFAENAVMTLTNNNVTSHEGKKLIITFRIKPIAGFIGGNDVFTNDASSGVYQPDGNGGMTSVENFPVPDVNVEFKDIEINGLDQYIYLSNYADLNVLLNSFTIKYRFAVNGKEYQVDGYRNGYAALRFRLKDPQNNAELYFTIYPGEETGVWTYVSNGAAVPGDAGMEIRRYLTKDTKYEISFEVFAKEDIDEKNRVIPSDADVQEEGKLDAWVHVFKPEVIFQDSRYEYMAPIADATIADDHYNLVNWLGDTQVHWTHPTYGAADGNRNITMHGPRPELTFEYSIALDSWIDSANQVYTTKCVPVDVTTVTAKSTHGTMDVTAATTSYRQGIDCACDNNAPTDTKTKVGDESIKEFVIHVYDVMSKLTIEKEGMQQGESAIVNVSISKDGKTDNYTIVFNDDVKTVIIANVLIGSTYEVTEQTAWSWRYTLGEPQYATANKTIVADATQNLVTIKNDRTNDKWLSDESAVENNLKDGTKDGLYNWFNNDTNK